MTNDLNDMALFVAVVKANSFRGAGAKLGIPSSTLSRRIDALEKSIGLRLLHRTTRQVNLTEAGRRYFERSKSIVEEAQLVHEEFGDLASQMTGVLKMSLSAEFGITYLAPLLQNFLKQHPGLSLELDLTPRNVDLINEPFDLAVRMGAPDAPGLITRVIARYLPRLYASPTYLEHVGELSHPRELGSHQCLAMATTPRWILNKAGKTEIVKPASRYRMNSIAMIRRLAVLGEGLAFVPERIVAEELMAGTLMPVLPDWIGEPGLVYVVTATRLLPAKTQKFIEFLREGLRDCE
ncbi:LysR family transcriptional regulator [Rhizobium sp. WYJ-E13]|uniref:LysR family transcriptional regulator n=1 Tax=Rhizobium sp. WYJ-E13 TaxID=2849093 RepID=UPI001C1E99C7|nr:LysR family transcriptional regulator [Rhizobium sp. WYJ-E13]QWW72566.1 LysR family transcriptional regulator [Rhizobium sp. WYJ-E13]